MNNTNLEPNKYYVAKWYLELDGAYIYCTKCKKEPPLEREEIYPHICPNCGAKMVGLC